MITDLTDENILPPVVRRWIPTDWLDEVVGGLGVSPSDFLKRTPEGVLQLYPLDPEEDGVDWRIRAVQPQEVVEFSWTENYGTGTLVVRPDGTWVCDTEFPATATHFWLPFDPSTMERSLEALVTGEGGWNIYGDALDPGEYTVGAYAWSEEPTKFCVRIRDTGAAEFVEVGTA